MSELLPCPFCGRKPEMWCGKENCTIHEPPDKVICVECGAVMGTVELWNTRVHPEWAVGLARAVKQLHEMPPIFPDNLSVAQLDALNTVSAAYRALPESVRRGVEGE